MIYNGDIINYRGHSFINFDGGLTNPVSGNIHMLDGFMEIEEDWRKQIYYMYLMEKMRQELEGKI